MHRFRSALSMRASTSDASKLDEGDLEDARQSSSLLSRISFRANRHPTSPPTAPVKPHPLLSVKIPPTEDVDDNNPQQSPQQQNFQLLTPSPTKGSFPSFFNQTSSSSTATDNTAFLRRPSARFLGSFSPPRNTTTVTTTTTLTIGEDDFSKLGTTVRQILDHDILGKRFRAFARNRMCSEGIDFLDDFAKQHSATDAALVSQRIMETYFQDNAPSAVNLSDSVRQTLFDRFQAAQFDSVYDLFEDAMYEVFADLKQSDTLRAFCREDEEAHKFASNTSVQILHAWLIPEHFRLAFSSCHDTETNMVRFCCSVHEFERTVDRKRRRERGVDICAKFCQVNSPYSVAQQMNQDYLQAIHKSKFERILSDARMEFCQLLAQNDQLVNAARKSQALRAKTSRVVNTSSSVSTSSRSSFIQLNPASMLEAVFIYTDEGGGARTRELTNLLNSRTSAPPTIWHIVNQIRFCDTVSEYFRAPSEAVKLRLELEFFQKSGVSNLNRILSIEEDKRYVASGNEDDFAQLLNSVFDRVIGELAANDEVMQAVAEIMLLRD